MHKEFTPGKLKPEYALVNKVLYEVMNGKVIDYDLVIWCVMRDFFKSTTKNRHIHFPTLVTNLVEAAGIRCLSREKRVLPRLGSITSITEAKS